MNDFLWLKNLNPALVHDSTWPVYVGLVFGIIVASYWLSGHKKDTDTPVAKLVLHLFYGLCICEIYHFRGYTGDPTWFCQPNHVGWTWAIINGILIATIILGQLSALFNILSVLDKDTGQCTNWKWCFFLIGLCIAAYLIGILVPAALTVSIVIFGVLQVAWPLWMIYANHRHLRTYWWLLLISYLVYLLGIYALLLTIVNLTA